MSLGSVTTGAIYLSSALIPAAPLGIRAGFIGAIMLLPSARQYSHITSGRNVAIDKGGVRLTQTWNTTDAAANAVGVQTSWITTYLVRDGECNAFTCEIGLCKEESIVAITTGLLRALTLRELCAVIAHELGHVKNRDYARSMHIKIATAGLGGIYTAGHALYRRAENRYVRIAVIPPAFALMLIGFASQIIAHLLRLADCRMAEFRADAVAAPADAFGAQTTIAALKKASPSCSTIADEGDL